MTNESERPFDPAPIRLISLPAVAAFSMTIFAVAVLMPPSWYETILQEQNHVFLDWRAIVFTVSCVAFFFLGYRWAIRRQGELRPTTESLESRWPIQLTDFALLGLLSTLHLVSLAILFKGGGLAMFRTWISGEASYGEFAKLQSDQSGVNALSMLHLSAFYLAWPFWLFLPRPDARLFRLCFAVFLFTFLLAGLPLGKRSFLFTAGNYHVSHLRVASLLPRGTSIGSSRKVCHCGLRIWSVCVSGRRYFQKGSDSIDDFTWELTRYLINPYNQQAMLLDGTLSFSGSGTGYFWTQWFWEFPLYRRR